MFRTMVGKDGGSDGVDQATHIVRWTASARSPRPQYVWTVPRHVAGRERERLVGQYSGLSHADLRADAPSRRSDRYGRRHHLHLRVQRYRGSVGSGETISQWARRENRRRRRDGASISSRRADHDLHFALSPVVLGQREAMFSGIDFPALGYRVTEHRATEHATTLFRPIGSTMTSGRDERQFTFANDA